MKRVGVYVDYGNVYHGARDAFILTSSPGYKGNINPFALGERVASREASSGADRTGSHALTFVKVFRGAPDPQRDAYGALIEAKRAERWEQLGCEVVRVPVDYGSGQPVEKGVDVAIATAITFDSLRDRVDVIVVVSADKDFAPNLNTVRQECAVEIETAIWVAIPGGSALGRIQLAKTNPQLGEVPFHGLTHDDYKAVEDTIDYRSRPAPKTWRGPVPTIPQGRGNRIVHHNFRMP